MSRDNEPTSIVTACVSLAVHPSCMDYSPELARKILSTTWQCTNCKTCSVCQDAKPEEDELMLFCDSCDLGYHMSCHKPPLTSKPKGTWECFKCKSQYAPDPTNDGQQQLPQQQLRPKLDLKPVDLAAMSEPTATLPTSKIRTSSTENSKIKACLICVKKSKHLELQRM